MTESIENVLKFIIPNEYGTGHFMANLFDETNLMLLRSISFRKKNKTSACQVSGTSFSIIK
jgi:hypothetical protein